MKQFDVLISGLQPLILHAPTGVDTTHPLTREKKTLTSKRKKTDADVEAIDWLEFQLALYHNDKGPYVPDINLLAAIRDGAKANRRGREVQAGVDVVETEIPLQYDGPTDVRALYDARFVDRRPAKNKGGGGTVMRVRPKFNRWSLRFRLLVDEKVMDPKDARAALEYAGLRSGLCDYRPRFGRFEIVDWKEAR